MQQTTPMAELPVADFSPSKIEGSFLKHRRCRRNDQRRIGFGLICSYGSHLASFLLQLGQGNSGIATGMQQYASIHFWSPPHFFVFVMTTMTATLVAFIAFSPRLRIWYGPGIRFPFLPFEIAGSLVVLGGGLVALTITILFDNFWHSTYGLDETQWSVPHCMLGWSWLTIILGFVAARLAFRNITLLIGLQISLWLYLFSNFSVQQSSGHST